MSQSQEPSALKPCPANFTEAYGKDAEAYWMAARFARECLDFTLEPWAEELRLMVGWFNRRAPSESEAVRAAYLDAAREAREPQVMILTHKDVADGILNDNHPVILARKQMREDIAKRLEAKAALPPSSGGEANKWPACPECGQKHDPSHHTRLKDAPALSESEKCDKEVERDMAKIGLVPDEAPAPSEPKHNSSRKLSDCADPKPSEVEEAIPDGDEMRQEWALVEADKADNPGKFPYRIKMALMILAAALRRERKELAQLKTSYHSLFRVSEIHKEARLKAEADLAELKESASFRIQDLGARLNATKLREEELAKEVEEQARLNGMGSEREARLMARAEKAEADVLGMKARNKELREDHAVAVERMRKAEARATELEERLPHYHNEKQCGVIAGKIEELKARVAELEKGER